MSRLIVLRHGQTAWNDAGRFQGAVDIDLDETGRAQAARAAKALAETDPAVIVASDLRRAFDTAQSVSQATGVEVRIDKRLRERAYGPWEGLTRAQIAERSPAEFAAWQARQPFSLEGIEPPSQVADRMVAALTEISADLEGGETAIVVSHGGVSRQGIAGFLGWGEGQAETMFGLGNCCWADLRSGLSGWRLFGWNQSATHD